MASSPSPTGQPDQTPAKTPGGWGRALGIFHTLTSTKKKQPPESSPPVDSSTNDTGMRNADLSRLTEESFHQHDSAARSSGFASTNSTPGETFMSPISQNSTTVKQSSSRRSNGGRKIPRLEFGALMSNRTPQSQARPSNGGIAAPNQFTVAGERASLRSTKSPWQNRSGALQKPTTATAAAPPSPWQTRRSHTDASSRPLALVTTTSNARARRYRPNAVGLVGSRPVGRRYRRAGEYNPERVSQALVSLKDSFMPAQSSDPSTNVFAVKGKVQWGTSSRPSRLPRPSQKRQRLEQPQQYDNDGNEEEDYEGERSKKRKKVSFNQGGDEDDAVVHKITATNFASTPAGNFKSAANRKGTPMPPKRSSESLDTPSHVSPTGTSESTGTPSSSISDSLPEKPPGIDFTVGQPMKFTATAETFDPPILNPNLKEKAFDWAKVKPPSSDNVAPKYHDSSEWESLRFEKPKSPPKEPSSANSDKPDDTKTQEQAIKRSKKDNSVNVDDDQPDWKCSNCGKFNKHDESKCTDGNCGTVRGAGIKPSGWGDLFANQTKGKWKCNACNVLNDDSATKCAACEVLKPGHENKAGAPAPAPTGAGQSSAPKTPFNFEAPKTSSTGDGAGSQKTQFGAPASTESKKFHFGAPVGKLPVPSGQSQEGNESKFAFNATSSSSSGFIFKAPSPAPGPAHSTAPFGGFTYGASKTDDKKEEKLDGTPAPAPPLFDFGQGDRSESKAAPASSSFGFSGGDGSQSGKEDESTAAPAPNNNFAFGSAHMPKTDDKSSTTPVSTSNSKPASDASFVTGSSAGLSAAAEPFKPSGENGDKKVASESNTVAFGSSGTGEQAGEKNTSIQGGFSFAGSTTFGQNDSSKRPANSFGSTNAGSVKRSRGYDLEETKTPIQESAPAPAFSYEDEKKTTSWTGPAAGFSFGSTPAPATDSKGAASGPSGGFSFMNSSAPAPGAGAGAGGFDFNSGSSASAPEDSKFAGSNAGGVETGPTLFGGPASAPSGVKPPFAFGSTPSGSSENGAGASFGASGGASSGTAPQTASQPAFNFGSSSQNATPAPAPSATAFGSSATPAASGGFGFGASSNAAPAPSFGATASGSSQPSFNFGASAPGPAFGAAQPPPAFAAPPQPAAAPTPGFTAPAQAATPAPAGGGFSFGSSAATQAATPGFGSGQVQAFGSAQPAAGMPAAPNFGTGSTPAGGFGGFNNPAAFGGSTPAPSGGSFGGGGFGAAPQTVGGFPSQQTPAPSGGFGGGGFGATPQTAPDAGAGFAIGTADRAKTKRRTVRAKRPTRN